MKNNSSSHSCGVGVSGHWSCLADSADASPLLRTKLGLLLQLALHEENTKNVPSHKCEQILLLQRTLVPKTLQTVRCKNYESSLLTTWDCLWANNYKNASIVLLQFAPQAKRHSGSQRGESVSPGVRSWCHHIEGERTDEVCVIPPPCLPKGQTGANWCLRGHEKSLSMANKRL